MQRRTVLRSAVKLAYATPLVVATANLTDFRPVGASGGIACVPSDCGPCEECWDDVGCVPIDGCIP